MKTQLAATVMLSLLGLLTATCLIPARNDDTMRVALYAATAVAFVLFVALYWRERPRDERDMQHQRMAGRAGFFAGVVALVGAVFWQFFTTAAADPLLVGVLSVMIVVKVVAQVIAAYRY